MTRLQAGTIPRVHINSSEIIPVTPGEGSMPVTIQNTSIGVTVENTPIGVTIESITQTVQESEVTIESGVLDHTVILVNNSSIISVFLKINNAPTTSERYEILLNDTYLLFSCDPSSTCTNYIFFTETMALKSGDTITVSYQNTDSSPISSLVRLMS